VQGLGATYAVRQHVVHRTAEQHPVQRPPVISWAPTRWAIACCWSRRAGVREQQPEARILEPCWGDRGRPGAGHGLLPRLLLWTSQLSRRRRAGRRSDSRDGQAGQKGLALPTLGAFRINDWPWKTDPGQGQPARRALKTVPYQSVPRANRRYQDIDDASSSGLDVHQKFKVMARRSSSSTARGATSTFGMARTNPEQYYRVITYDDRAVRVVPTSERRLLDRAWTDSSPYYGFYLAVPSAVVGRASRQHVCTVGFARQAR